MMLCALEEIVRDIFITSKPLENDLDRDYFKSEKLEFDLRDEVEC